MAMVIKQSLAHAFSGVRRNKFSSWTLRPEEQRDYQQTDVEDADQEKQILIGLGQSLIDQGVRKQRSGAFLQGEAVLAGVDQHALNLRERVQALAFRESSALERGDRIQIKKRVALKKESQNRDAESFTEAACHADHTAAHAGAAFWNGREGDGVKRRVQARLADAFDAHKKENEPDGAPERQLR